MRIVAGNHTNQPPLEDEESPNWLRPRPQRPSLR